MCKLELWIAMVLLSLPAVGQLPPNFGTPSGPPERDNYTQRTLFLSGRVKADDSGHLPEAAQVATECNGQTKTQVYTDGEGYFNFQLSSSHSANITQSGVTLPLDSASDPVLNWQICELVVQAPGFHTRKVQLTSVTDSWGLVNLGTIVISRSEKADSFTISAADMAAPTPAKKEFEKGKQEEKKGKWAAARERFQKALAHYPEFALAWLELGKVQTEQSDFTEARQSFRKALRADSKMSSAYLGLAQVAAQEGNWPELAATTDRMLEQSDAVAAPQPWFLNAVAYFNLHQYERAETSALQAIRLDKDHAVPRATYLLGLILANRHDYRGAAEQVQAYLASSPNRSDAAAAQTNLAEFQKLAGISTSVPLVPSPRK